MAQKKPVTLAEGIESYPKSVIIFGNLMMALWIGLGTLALSLLSPLLGWVYLILAVFSVYILLRKLVCTNCYYYGKWCPIGWGKLSALFFNQGNIENFSKSIGVKLAPIVYGLLTLIPMIVVTISLIQQSTVPKLLVLLAILLIGFYSGTLSRKKTCRNCKMRLLCPGSAVKKR